MNKCIFTAFYIFTGLLNFFTMSIEMCFEVPESYMGIDEKVILFLCLNGDNGT